MSKGTRVLAIACWIFAAATANAQYGPVLSGQPAMGPAAPPSADYYNNYNAYQRRLAANSGGAPTAPANYAPANAGWSANGAAPGSPTATGFPYNVGRTTLAAAQYNQGLPTPAFPEQSPGDLLTGNPTVPNFDDPASTQMIGPGNIAPTQNGGQSGSNANPSAMNGNTGPQGNNSGFGNSGFGNSGFGNGGCASGNCGSGNCGSPCGSCCQPCGGCCAGRMGPGPLFYSGTCCSGLSFLHGCMNQFGLAGGMGGYGGGMGGYGGGMGGGYGAGMGGFGMALVTEPAWAGMADWVSAVWA